ETVQGALQVVNELAFWLLDLTGMYGVAMSPKAGAHGELCGLLCIRAALESRGDKREVVLVPESAHGTNPATAAFVGYRVENIPATEAGRVDLEALKARLGPDVAGVMITNPNTCGLFEPDMIAISEAVHAAGGFVYCDGANFNAIVGKVRPGDLGIDAMHINLHKTFSTPHGGGGPGSGPVVLSDALSPFAPLPFVEKKDEQYRLIDEGFHPMTMYFPLVVHGAMLIEPTETESKASLDQFIKALRSIAERAKAGDQSLKAAPVHAPRRRLDETLAARKPVLTFRNPEAAQAAE